MILYRLRCAKKHEFDSWFPSGSAYERQEKRGLIECPECGSKKVERSIMAPRIGKGSDAQETVAVEAPHAVGEAPMLSPDSAAVANMPPEMRKMLRAIRRHVEKNSEYVGPNFAEEARAIHYGEKAERGIYGETSPGEAEELAEEGIEVGRIPWLPTEN
jgi:hypothetical protein